MLLLMEVVVILVIIVLMHAHHQTILRLQILLIGLLLMLPPLLLSLFAIVCRTRRLLHQNWAYGGRSAGIGSLLLQFDLSQSRPLYRRCRRSAANATVERV